MLTRTVYCVVINVLTCLTQNIVERVMHIILSKFGSQNRTVRKLRRICDRIKSPVQMGSGVVQ